ncbi:MAG: hypothetical protein WCA15_11380, partial [Candidatus Acidiferrales bacterium]
MTVEPPPTIAASEMRPRFTSANLPLEHPDLSLNRMNRISRRNFLESLALMGLALPIPIQEAFFDVKHPRGLDFEHVNS